MKKPDRWERVVDMKSLPGGVLAAAEVIKLLRKEHAWVRRMVLDYKERSMECCWTTPTTDMVIGYELACTLILNKLKERAQ